MNKLDRRTFLRGTGLGVGLPLLHAMNPNTSVFAAAPEPPPKRMDFVFIPNGAIMDSWKQAGDGDVYKRQSWNLGSLRATEIRMFSQIPSTS